MAFTPQTMDGQAAAQRMLGWETFDKHACLRAVHAAFPFSRSDSPGAYSSARVQWERTPASRRRVGDRNAPAGALVFFDLAVASIPGRPGHIGISLGGDRFVSTDWPTPGTISVATIGAVERKWRARYLGWTDVVGGHNVTTADTPRPAPAGVGGTIPVPTAAPAPEIEEVEPMKVITASSAGVKYELRAGRKRSIGQAEWRALRALEQAGLELHVATIAQKDIDAIPGS